MSYINWITPEGFLFTATESVYTSTNLEATSTIVSNINYTIISGDIPQGLTFSSTGTISGVPENVLNLTTNTFIVRAQINNSFADRNFYINIEGSDLPVWNTLTITTGTSNTLTTSTTEGYLQIGVNNLHYIFDNQWVDYQLSASPIETPLNTKISYYILPGDGILPTGLTLDINGRLHGFTNTLDNTISSATCSSNLINELSAVVTNNNSNAFQYITENIKIYGFNVTAFDGAVASKRFFKILIINPNIFRADSTTLPANVDVLGLDYIPSSVSFLAHPQFLKNSNLGNVKIRNNVFFDVSAYNSNKSDGTITYTINTESGTLINLPKNLSLYNNFGFIEGNVNYQKEYLKEYQFTLKASNISKNNLDSITVNNTFTFSIQDSINEPVIWKTTGFLGTLTTNEISELYVKAETILNIKYELESGTLPPGLILNSDGTISGSVSPNTSITTTQTNYYFSILITDNNKNKFINGNFYITIKQTSETEFINVWARPYLSLEKRKEFQNFINNNEIFKEEYIYRPLDINFGIQKNLKMYIHYGLEKENLADYIPTISQNFQKRNFILGNVSIANAIVDNVYYYDLIYINIIDKLTSETQNLPMNFSFNGKTYYPTTLKNMRERFSNFHVTTENLNLKILKPSQFQKSIKFFSFIPLCFAKPNSGYYILNKIQQLKFKFNTFDFSMDRIIFQSSKDFPNNKYLLIK